jgi:hypothetical protein
MIKTRDRGESSVSRGSNLAVQLLEKQIVSKAFLKETAKVFGLVMKPFSPSNLFDLI